MSAVEYIGIFFTQAGALKYQRYMKRENIEIELGPVPRLLSSNCGIGARFSLKGDVQRYISADMEMLFKITASGYELIFANE